MNFLSLIIHAETCWLILLWHHYVTYTTPLERDTVPFHFRLYTDSHMHPRVHLWEFTYRDDDPIYCVTTFMAAKEHHKNKRPSSRSWRPSAAMIFICRAATCYGGMNWTTRASSPTVSWPFSTKKQSLSDKLWKTICWLILLKYWLFSSIEIKYVKKARSCQFYAVFVKVSEHRTPTRASEGTNKRMQTMRKALPTAPISWCFLN